MPVDDVARAPQPEFSQSSDALRLRFERATEMAAGGAEPEHVAEALLEGAEPADLLEAEQWPSLPPAGRREASLQAACLAAGGDDDEAPWSAPPRALALEPADERALAIAEPL